MIHSTRYLILVALVALVAPACGSSPVSYSAPVGINLNAKSGDVASNVVSQMKEITTETSNPYGAFINNAQAKLGGKDPSSIEINTLTLLLGGQSTGVTALDQVLTGDVDVAFIIDATNNTYDTGHVMNPTGIGPVTVNVAFDSTGLAPQDWTQFLNGQFKVVIRGAAAAGFVTKGAQANLQLTFTFDALQ